MEDLEGLAVRLLGRPVAAERGIDGRVDPLLERDGALGL